MSIVLVILGLERQRQADSRPASLTCLTNKLLVSEGAFLRINKVGVV